MLLEPGPIAPIDVDAWTRPGPRTNLEADAALLANQLRGAQSTIASHQATMANDSTAAAVVGVGPDIDEQLDELARQTSAFDPSIGTVAGNADAQAGSIDGFGNEAGQAIADAVAPEPGPQVSYPPQPDWNLGNPGNEPPPQEPPPPGGTVQDFIIGLYQKYLRRTPAQSEINGWAQQWPHSDVIEHGILYSDEYAGKVKTLYNNYFGRDPHDDELADARNNQWGLDEVEADLHSRS